MIIDRCISACELIKKYASNKKSDGTNSDNEDGGIDDEDTEIECLLLDGQSIFKYSKQMSACFTLSDLRIIEEGIMQNSSCGSTAAAAASDGRDSTDISYLVLGVKIPHQPSSANTGTTTSCGDDNGRGVSELAYKVTKLKKAQPHRECGSRAFLYVEKSISSSILTATQPTEVVTNIAAPVPPSSPPNCRDEQVLFFFAAPPGKFMPLSDWLATKRPLEQVRTVFRQILQEFQVTFSFNSLFYSSFLSLSPHALVSI